MLNEKLVGRTIAFAKESLKKELVKDIGVRNQLLERAGIFSSLIFPEGSEVQVEGLLHFVEQPEFADIKKLNEILQAI